MHIIFYLPSVLFCTKQFSKEPFIVRQALWWRHTYLCVQCKWYEMHMWKYRNQRPDAEAKGFNCEFRFQLKRIQWISWRVTFHPILISSTACSHSIEMIFQFIFRIQMWKKRRKIIFGQINSFLFTYPTSFE